MIKGGLKYKIAVIDWSFSRILRRVEPILTPVGNPQKVYASKSDIFRDDDGWSRVSATNLAERYNTLTVGINIYAYEAQKIYSRFRNFLQWEREARAQARHAPLRDSGVSGRSFPLSFVFLSNVSTWWVGVYVSCDRDSSADI